MSILLNPKTTNKIPFVSKSIRLYKPENLHVLSRKVALQNWDTVFSATVVDVKVQVFNKTILTMLDEAMLEKTIRIHPSDKPRITSDIKAQIKARQKAFCQGDKNKYKLAIMRKVSNLILKAKEAYYRTKAKDFRQTNPAKWYKTVYSLLGAQKDQKSLQSPSEEELSELAELLQGAFTKPRVDVNTDSIAINEVDHLLKHTSPPLPSQGQVRIDLVLST